MYINIYGPLALAQLAVSKVSTATTSASSEAILTTVEATKLSLSNK